MRRKKVIIIFHSFRNLLNGYFSEEEVESLEDEDMDEEFDEEEEEEDEGNIRKLQIILTHLISEEDDEEEFELESLEDEDEDDDYYDEDDYDY